MFSNIGNFPKQPVHLLGHNGLLQEGSDIMCGKGWLKTTRLEEVTCDVCWTVHLQNCITDGILTREEAMAEFRRYRIPSSWEYIEREIEHRAERDK